jgi:hypothetical protein
MCTLAYVTAPVFDDSISSLLPLLCCIFFFPHVRPPPWFNGIIMSYNTATLNHGPLTTLFTPPASCASTTIDERSSGLPPFIFQALSGGIPPGGDAKFSTYKQCYPSTTSNAENADNWSQFWYSPGVCPSGWPAACQMTQFPVGSVDTMSVFPTETRGVVCCPS